MNSRAPGFPIMLFFMATFLIAFPASQTPRPDMTTVELQSNEAELYPRHEEIALKAIERLPEGVGIRLELRSDITNFSHFLYSMNEAPWQKSRDGILDIRFVDSHKPEVQKILTVIRAADDSGKESREYNLAINYYPRELYEKSGQKAPGYVIVQKSDIPFSQSKVEDWIVASLNAEEAAYAKKTWGGIIQSSSPPRENARRLAKAILDALTPHRGIPSDNMNTSAFEQYRRAISGEDKVWCGNLAQIFIHACRAFQIPARIIGMNRVHSTGKNFDLLLAEGHSTTEIFDETLNRWIWIDLTFNILGMELENGGPLHMAELYRLLNDPEKNHLLISTEYEPATKAEKRVKVLESQYLGSLLNYFKKDQTFRYTRLSKE
jgi:hypothetical protein